jgi:precorrin-6B methylase 2
MKPFINWQELQRLAMPGPAPVGGQGRGGGIWDDNAPMYNQIALMEREYTRLQLAPLGISKDDTVLDIGCGPGRISVLSAEISKSVTAIDTSPVMLKFCEENCERFGVSNVTRKLLDWNEVKPGETLEKHSVVIASRSVGLYDVLKLNSMSSGIVAIMAWANAPNIPEILNEMFIGTSGNPMPYSPPARADRRLGYNVFFNIVYDHGFDPNIEIVNDGFEKTYPSREEAYADLRRLRPFPDDKLPVFRSNVDKLISDNLDGTVTFRRLTRTFVLWWKARADIGEQ